MIPLELTVRPHPDDGFVYMACWSDGDTLLAHIPECWLDLVPFMIARRLLEQGNNAERLLIVRLEGADRELMRGPLAVVAATPLLNHDAPVWQPAQCVFRRRERHG